MNTTAAYPTTLKKIIKHKILQGILSKKNSMTNLIAAILIITISDSMVQAQSISNLKLAANKIPWTDLSFHAKNFMVEVSTQVQLKSLPVSEIESQLLTAPRGLPVQPSSSQVYQITINTTIDPIFRSPVSIYNRIWFNPTDASALGRVRLRRGEDDFKKSYRFTDQGVFRHQLEPKDKREAALEPEKWSRIKDSFYPYDLSQLGCGGASERSLLIYILSAADISSMKNPFTVCAFGKRQLHRVKVQKEGIYPLSISFMEKNRHNEIRKEERINAIKFTITAEPMKSDLKEPEDFSFLGLHQDITIYLDPAMHLPVQVSGIIPTVGKVHIKLSAVQIR